MQAVSLLITGQVQGVFFRTSARDKAKELGLAGWVRNTENGNVEIHAEGNANALRKFETWCHTGPPSAEVKSVSAEDTDKQDLSDFSITN